MSKNHFPDAGYLHQLARYAGEVMRSGFRLGMERSVKDDGTPLTEFDTAINQHVINSIRCDYPHVGVIGEEGSYEVDDAEYVVLVDPIDGTIPFSRGVPISAFVAAVVHAGQPVSAVVHDPFLGRTWLAERGSGATMNGAPVQVSQHAVLRDSNICLCWWRGSPFNLHGVCEELMVAGAIWTNPCSIAYYGGLLASGEQDATIFPGLDGWETAAMHLIAEEAGGRATDINGDPLKYDSNGAIRGHIISNGLLHDDLIEIVNSCQS